MRLDNRYFEEITTKWYNGSVLESYKSVHARSTMVLFSRQSHTPLAALTLKPTKDIGGCLAMLTGRPSPKHATEPHFQGILNMPNQSFTFVITNLSDAGMINFNILHTPHRVSEVDPGPSYGVNEVNELQANQSYEIEADQRTNRVMVLKGKTEKKFDAILNQSKVVPLTVDESESTKVKTKEGLYFYLSVVPDASSQTLVKKFKEGTTWKAVSGFVRRTQSASPHRVYNSQSSHRMHPLASAVSSGSSRSPDAPLYGGLATPGPFQRELRLQQRSHGSLVGSSQANGCASAADSISASFAHSARPNNRHYGGPPLWFNNLIHTANAPRLFDGMDGAGERSHGDNSMGAMMGAPVFAANVDVGSTQAGELVSGEHINVYSQSTGHEYAYEHTSAPTVLCMSIWEDMKFLPLLDTVEKMLEAELKEWTDNEGKALVKSLNVIFKEDKCVIDLESDTDTIVCTCGHQCINHANVTSDLSRCPLCRSPITAFVRADGIISSID